MNSIRNVRHWAARLFAVGMLASAGLAQAASTGTQLMRITGGGGLRSNGDYVSSQLNTTYRFFVEVPPNTPTLTIDIFDPDFGVGGTTEEAADRDRQRNGFDSEVTYRLFNPANTAQTVRFNRGNDFSTVGGTTTGLRNAAGTGISCSTTVTQSGDNNWCQIFTTANPAAGHWRLEIDTSADTGDDVGAFGIRAHDGNTGAGGVELNMYGESFVQIGVNQIDGGGSRSAVFNYYPYVIRGCSVNTNDFDNDNGTALTVGGQAQSEVLVNRGGAYTTTFANGALSGNDDWAENPTPVPANPTVGPSGTNTTRNGMGLWSATHRINEANNDNANYATLYYTQEGAATPVAGTEPNAQPEAEAFRIYVPTDAGAAPLKPYLWQQVFYSSGTTPPAIGQTTVFTINVRIVNPTSFPITINGTSGQSILARVPNNGAVTYVAGSVSASQGTPTTAGGGNRNITWNPGTIAAGAEELMTYRVSVTPTAATTNITGAGNATAFGDTLGTRADFWDETGVLTSGGASDIAFGGLCPLQILAGTVVPTPVTLSWMKATRAGNSLDVSWTTDSEHSSFGFDVYGSRGGTWVKLNAKPVISHHDTAEPQLYTIRIDNAAGVEEVALEELGATGSRQRFAKLAIDAEIGQRIEPTRIDWATARAEANAAIASRGLAALGGTGAPRAYLDVDRDGIWRVRVTDLASAGLDFSGVATADLALTLDGRPVALRVRNAAGALLGSNAVVEFHGTARQSLYGMRNAYLLTADAANARRVTESEGAAQPWPTTLSSYAHENVRQNDTSYSFASRGDPWYDTFTFALPGAPAQQDFPLIADAIATSTGASVLVDVTGATDWSDLADDHHVEVLFNGNTVGSHDFPARDRALLRFEVPAGSLATGSNTLSLRLPGSQLGTGQYDGIFVEKLALTYQRTFAAASGELSAQLGTPGDNEATSDVLYRDGMGDTPGACARGNCAAVTTTGWNGGAVNAWVVGARGDMALSDATVVGGTLRVVAPTGQANRLVIADEAHVRTPVVRIASPSADLSLPSAQLLVIAHPSFTAGLSGFVTARQAEGLTVRVVETEQVYARYSNGQADPSAIQRLLADAYATGTRYALLVGGDTYDYDNHAGTGAISFVPTVYTNTGDFVNYAPADTLYGDVDGDGVSEIAVGRWPVRTAAQLAAVVQKTLAYDAADHQGKALFVSSQPETDLDFTALSASLRAPLDAQGWATDVIGATGVGTPDSSQAAVLAALDQGRALTNFVGHSSVIRWQANANSASSLLDGTTAEASLSNAARPTVLAHWGCLAGWFVSINYDSMSQKLLLDADGGAAAAVGAATLVDTPQQDEFIRLFLERAGTGSVRIGDALDSTRRDFASQVGSRRDLVYGINLLGDPTLKIRR